MKAEGITVSPIINMAGEHAFNMVTFESVRVPKKIWSENIIGVGT